MNARITQRVLPAVLAVSALGIAAPTASAASLTPASHDFGDQPVGTTGAPYTFILSASCTVEATADPALCGGSQPVTPAVSSTGDFTQTNNCPLTLRPVVTCTINVIFTPRAAGFRTGTLTAASGVTSSLSGTGVAVPARLKAAIKKCKKKFPKGPKRKKCIKKAKKRLLS
jgi:hypothetical protein